MKRNRSKNLPAFKSVDELVAFFETHDMGEYWEKLPEVEFEVSLRKRADIRRPKKKAIRTKPSKKSWKKSVG